jgi:hypothetical protein
LARYLERKDWETDVARYGIDIWMTTIAVAEGFRVCQSFLGAKLHDAKDPGADLSAMLHQVVGSVFTLMQEYRDVWWPIQETRPVELFGFRYAVGLDPIDVNLDRMLDVFRRGREELVEIWSQALQPSTLSALQQLHIDPHTFHLDPHLWARVIYDFAVAHRRWPLDRAVLLRSLTPLYLARVASFVVETRDLGSSEVEERIEHLCLAFEDAKHELRARWERGAGPASDTPQDRAGVPAESTTEVAT